MHILDRRYQLFRCLSWENHRCKHLCTPLNNQTSRRMNAFVYYISIAILSTVIAVWLLPNHAALISKYHLEVWHDEKTLMIMTIQVSVKMILMCPYVLYVGAVFLLPTPSLKVWPVTSLYSKTWSEWTAFVTWKIVSLYFVRSCLTLRVCVFVFLCVGVFRGTCPNGWRQKL